MLLALSENSPFWQGRDTGLASARTPIAAELMHACGPHAAELGCGAELDLLTELLDNPGPARQRALAAGDGPEGLAAGLAVEFNVPLPVLARDAA